MLVYSEQHRIVNNTALSFKKNEKTFAKISGASLERDQYFLKARKFETLPEADFKFMVLWSVFKGNTNKIDTLKLLQSYDKEDLKIINKERENIVLYKNTFKNDIGFTNEKIKTPQNILNMYQKNEISYLYVYYYFNKVVDQEIKFSRIQQRKIDRIKFFLSYFEPIKNYLENYDT